MRKVLLDLISVTEFVQPLDEQIIDDQDDIFDFIVESYSLDLDDQDKVIDNDIEAPIITISKAIKALDYLKLFELQQDIGEKGNILALERLERGLYQRRQLNYKQKTLDSFFSRVNIGGKAIQGLLIISRATPL